MNEKVEQGLLLCVCLLTLLVAGCVTNDARTLFIVGEGVVVATPDAATVRCMAQSSQPSLQEAKLDVDERVSRLLDSLAEFSSETNALKAGQITVKMDYEWKDSRNREFIGYEVSRPISITLTNLAELDGLYSAIVEAGIDEIGSVKFFSSREEEFQQEAEVLAMQDAVRRATLAASEGGVKLGAVDTISIPHSQSPWGSGYEWGWEDSFDGEFIELGTAMQMRRPAYSSGAVEIRAKANVTWTLED